MQKKLKQSIRLRTKMKLCKSNIFLNKVFVQDKEANLNYFSYECERNINRVLVSSNPEIIVNCENIENIGIYPFRFSSEKQFNSLAIEALLEACRINYNKRRHFPAINEFFNSELPFGNILISKDTEITEPIAEKLFGTCGIKGDNLWDTKILNIIRVDGLKKNQFLFTANPDYLGVVAVCGDDLDKYAIGIINSRAALLVDIN